MRALRLHQPGPVATAPLRLEEVADPEPGRGELLVRVGACAVCRTDLQIVEGDLPVHRAPVVPGHQVAGVVEGLGPEVDGWSVGDRVGITWLAGFDGTCDRCRSGRPNLCRRATFTGWDRDGGYATLTTVRADAAARLPAGLDDLAAAPLLCGGVIGFRALRLTGLDPRSSGARLGLYGFGASALQAIQVAGHWGWEVHVASRSTADLERAERFGAASVGGYADPPPRPLDAAITFAPVGSVVVAALKAVDRGATVVVNAIHLDGIPAFDYDDLWWERSIRSVANVTPDDARDYLELAAAIPVRTEIVPLPLANGNEALARLERGEIEGAAVLVPEPVGPA
ncbi:MAG TPA: zinc-dependent alcohol dehydrogenase family protein [Candidatus Limnocylindrales bacterium]|nr:zinc-dependent alcohol dehydrogenase family protein [Candidatus Limnocylindrales bacterium]